MRLIDADALLEAMEKERQYLLARGQHGAEHILVHHCLPLIDNAPTVDLWQLRQEATENALKKAEVLYGRPQGEWIKMAFDDKTILYCSECHSHFEYPFDFCPNCGASMKGGDIYAD